MIDVVEQGPIFSSMLAATHYQGMYTLVLVVLIGHLINNAFLLFHRPMLTWTHRFTLRMTGEITWLVFIFIRDMTLNLTFALSLILLLPALLGYYAAHLSPACVVSTFALLSALIIRQFWKIDIEPIPYVFYALSLVGGLVAFLATVIYVY